MDLELMKIRLWFIQADDSIEVVGESGLLIVDLQGATTPKGKRFAMNNVTMHYLEKGDRFNVK